jgi:glycosyltransferase involved in cell wall biosynthesis
MQKKVLFISHSAGRTGAPMFLLQFLKWLKTTARLPLQTVQLNRGELLEEFQATAETTLCIPEKIDRYADRLYTFLGIQHDIFDFCYRRFSNKMAGAGIGLIYANTITNGRMLSHLARLGCPVICHVHEMEAMIRYFGPKNMEQNKACITHYIAVTDLVKQNLVRNHGIPEGSIDVVYPCLDIPGLPDRFSDIRPALNIPHGACIVVAAGKGVPGIKGKDLFIQLAYTVAQKQPDLPVHFIWVGGDRNEFDEYLLRQDVERAGLTGRLHFTYDVTNPLDYFSAGDVFVSVSREDSFPLVCLEAAALGKPILCFDKGGGMPEFVADDAGYIVPYLDIAAMAEKIIALAGQPEVKNRLGRRASEKIRQRHDMSMAFPVILKVMQRFL